MWVLAKFQKIQHFEDISDFCIFSRFPSFSLRPASAQGPLCCPDSYRGGLCAPAGGACDHFLARMHLQSDQEHYTITFEKFKFLKIFELFRHFQGVALLPGISALSIHLVSQVMRRSRGGREVDPWTSRGRKYNPVVGPDP